MKVHIQDYAIHEHLMSIGVWVEWEEGDEGRHLLHVIHDSSDEPKVFIDGAAVSSERGLSK